MFYFMFSIFESAGLSTANAEWANLGAGCLNLPTSFLGPILMTKVNRRSLMLFSSASLLLSRALISQQSRIVEKSIDGISLNSR